MTIKRTIIIITSIACFFSCTFKSKLTTDNLVNGLYEVDLENIPKDTDDTLFYSSVYKGIKTILLETNETCLIGGINKMHIHDDLIIILDRRYARSLYVFDKNGRFIRKIGSVGNGPGEYVEVTDFTIDKENNTIYLFDTMMGRINKYDFATGRFINVINLNPSIESRRIAYIGGKIYTDVYYSKHADDNCLLRVIDESSGEEELFLNVMEYHKGISNTNNTAQIQVFFLLENGNIAFFQQFMNQIVEISKNGISTLVNFKGNNISTNLIKKAIENDPASYYDNIELLNTRIFLQLADIIEHEEYLHFSYCQYLSPVKFIINKQTKEVKVYPNHRDDLFLTARYYGPLLHFGCYDSNGSYYYVPQMGMSHFVATVNDNGLPPDFDRLEELKNLTDEANPVIFYHEFK